MSTPTQAQAQAPSQEPTEDPGWDLTAPLREAIADALEARGRPLDGELWINDVF